MITTITTPSPINTTITYEGGEIVTTTLNQSVAIATIVNIGLPGSSSEGTQVNANWDSTSGVSQILNKPSTFPPEAHTHSQYALSSSLSTVALSGDYTDLVGLPTLGTASALNVSVGATATSNEVVKGNDTRLSDARTPLSHTHTKSEVGLANVDNTSDVNKPISTATQTALNAKFNIPVGDTTQYVAGDGSLVSFPIAGQAGTLVRQVRNETGATLTKGTIVYINGAGGNKPTVTKAIATSDATSAQTFGFVQADIPTNQNGYVVVRGDLVGIDTSAIDEGTQLYLSGSIAGTYTTVKPVAPLHIVYVGIVTRQHNTQGQIEVAIQNGYELDELHDVLITNKTDNQVLSYEHSTNLWKNKTIVTLLGYTPYNSTNPNGYTANSTDPQLRDRSTHTGTQLSSTISDFNTAVDARIVGSLHTGVVEVDFGAVGGLGTSEVSVAVTGQTVITSSKIISARIDLSTTSNHTIEDHKYAATFLGVTVGDIVDGVGFTIHVRTLYPMTGKFNIRWAWQ